MCKTPVGNSTPPLPYSIIGEFSDATGVSRNITSNGDPVVIHASTTIPSVKGDSAGSAHGVKSGTTGDVVQHDEKSSKVKFNGEKTVRVGDQVYMNSKNTSGKIHERGGESAKPRIAPVGTAPPPPKETAGDKFDNAIDTAANKIRAGEAWVGEKVQAFAQTSVGGKVMDAVKWVSDKTEMTAVKEFKEGLEAGVDSAVDGSGGSTGMMAVASVTKGALELIPTSLLDIIPGGEGKALSEASKIEHAAAEAASLAHKAEDAAKLAEKGAKDAEHLAEDAKNAGKGGEKPPPDGKDGSKSKKNGKPKKKLKCGEYGTYKDLKKKTGDNKFDRDHIPSKAALKAKAQELNKGVELSTPQKKAIDAWGETIAIPKQAHIDVSPTYGQTEAEAIKDAGNLAGSARRDVEAMLGKIDKYDVDGKCKKAYQKAAAKVMRMDNATFDKELKKILAEVE